MKKLMITLGALAAAVAFTAHAEETPDPNVAAAPETAASETAEVEPAGIEDEEDESSFFEVAFEVDVKSAYVSRNRIFSDTPVAQYDLWMQVNLPEPFGWLAVDVWANQELNKRHSSRSHGNGGKQFGGIGEFDYEIAYGNSVGPVNLTASHLWYTYPRCGWHSQNFWTVGAEYDNEIVVPSVKFLWEYHHDNSPADTYMIDFALSRGFELTEQLTLKAITKTTLFTAQYAKHISGGELNDAVFGGWDNGLALSYAITDSITLGAHINYLYKLDHRVRHCPGWDAYSTGGSHGTHAGFLYGGVSVSFSF